MLKEKRWSFEEIFSIPKEEWLLGDGWLTPFCWTYKASYQSLHHKTGGIFNETDLFAFASPDHGLSTKQMSRKKKEESHITISLAAM
ncbi:hypothetical protein PAXRUDRAFT_166322 [Paxillus rubicundulus Ve08.2h10]|uniref:Uncharacterized protein n=1 Tax=Paxillus rubicundulus Ve08.2h10 TaxID=930991 RepID=A0A0D0DHQ9_9AGAM|nr:hypothetical protein PAXRUDRAFT_166322 [Paxillus rubicundulus Ve08.2h10]